MEALELEDYKSLSRNNDFTVRFSNQCGCYHCLKKFPASEVRDWVDEGATAVCPKCGIDAVLPDSMVEITVGRLRELQEKYFKKKLDKK